MDPKEVYAQFHDMYKKYFGDNADEPGTTGDSEVREIGRGTL